MNVFTIGVASFYSRAERISSCVARLKKNKLIKLGGMVLSATEPRVGASHALTHSMNAFDYTHAECYFVLGRHVSFCCWENNGFSPRRRREVCL